MIWLYIALNRSPNIDCYWLGAVLNPNSMAPVGCLGFLQGLTEGFKPLMYYGILWDIMVCFGILWEILGYYEILWYIMVCLEILWDIMVYFGILCDILGYYVIFWCLFPGVPSHLVHTMGFGALCFC